MSLMADFDFVSEISRNALLNLTKTAFVIQGKPANPPFEFTLPIPSASASAHIIVNAIDIALTSDDRMAITLGFHDSSVIGESPLIAVSGLAGSVVVKPQVGLVAAPSDATKWEFALNFGSASVTLNYTTPNSKIAAGLFGSGITVSQFKTLSQQAVASFLTSIGFYRFSPVAFRVIPGVNGSINPLQFVQLEAHCIGNTDPAKQALGFFGILLLANTGNGDHTQKSVTAIAPPHDVAVSISPGAFHTLQFCPAVAGSVGTDVGSLPFTCGTSLGVDKNDVTLNFLIDTFDFGHVNMDGIFSGSRFCVEFSGSFHGEITFAVSGTTLTPNLQMDEPQVEPDIDWYCGPIGGIAIGVEALVDLGIANAIVQSVADGYAQDALDGMVGVVSPTQLGGFGVVSFDTVVVTPEGLTLEGVIPMFVPAGGSPDLTLDGSVATTSATPVSSGVVSWGLPPFCAPKDFDYTELAQQQSGTYKAIPKLLGEPLKLDWSIVVAQSVPLMGSSGTVTFTTSTYYPMPIDLGGSNLTQDVHIDFAVGNGTITIKNHPADGNYSFSLKCKATDPLNVVEEATIYVAFEGSAIEYEADYYDYVNQCTAAAERFFATISDTYKQANRFIPPWVPIDTPAPEKVVELVISLATSPLPDAPRLLAQAAAAHRSSYVQAILAAKAGTLANVKGKINAPGLG